jgi:imidazole glycerol-phosphate synthase subunit HisF
MSRYLRLIPRLDIKGPNLVKGINLEGLRVLGNPEVFAKIYTEQGADELFYMDVVASLYERNSIHNLISNVAKNNFIPITVGGGLRQIDDISKALDHGADKVSLNTAVLRRPDLISEAANKFGSSTIVVSVEVIKQLDGKYHCFIDNGREQTGREVFSWLKEVVDRGAGEIVITMVDREGTGSGYDIPLIKEVCEIVKVPVVAHGGVGKIEHILEVVEQTQVSGIVLASVLHYQLVRDLETLREASQINFMKNGFQIKRIQPFSLVDIAKALSEKNIICRCV